MCNYPCPHMWRCLCAHPAVGTATVCVHPAKESAGTWRGWSRSLHTQRQPIFAVHIFKCTTGRGCVPRYMKEGNVSV